MDTEQHTDEIDEIELIEIGEASEITQGGNAGAGDSCNGSSTQSHC